MTWLFHKVIVLQIIKIHSLPQFNETIPGRVSSLWTHQQSLSRHHQKTKPHICNNMKNVESSGGTLPLQYGWDPLTKVITCVIRVMCAKKFVIEKFYIFHIIANMGYYFLAVTGQALLMSPGMVSLNYGSRFILFAILLLCEITT